jgi:hypothetical protein
MLAVVTRSQPQAQDPDSLAFARRDQERTGICPPLAPVLILNSRGPRPGTLAHKLRWQPAPAHGLVTCCSKR